MASAQNQNGSLGGLTALRFPAAAAVALYHITPFLVTLPAVTELTNTGYTGVAFFFCLSGFVLTWAYDGRARGAGVFWLHRFARVYPLHALYWVVVGLIALVGFAPSVTHSDRAWWLGLGLVQSWTGNLNDSLSFNSPAWSLSCEAAFYAVFPLLVRCIPARIDDPRKTAALVVGVPLAVGVAVRLILLHYSGGQAAVEPVQWLYVFPPYRFPEFLLGIVLARSVRSGWRPEGGPWAQAARVLMAIAALAIIDKGLGTVTPSHTQLPFDLGNLLLILPFGWLIAAIAVADMAGARRPRTLVVLGTWAFAIYLCQGSINITLGLGLPERQPALVGLAELMLVFGVTVAVAAASHRIVEEPLNRLLRRNLRIRRTIDGSQGISEESASADGTPSVWLGPS